MRSREISSWVSTASSAPNSIPARLTWAFAPSHTAIWFSPWASTMMSAVPVSAPTSAMSATSTPAWRKAGEHCLAVGIGSDRTDYAGARTEAGGRGGLIRSLPTGRAREPAASHGLSGAGQSGGGGGEVGVDAADDRQGTVDAHVPILMRGHPVGNCGGSGIGQRRGNANRPAIPDFSGIAGRFIRGE
jgi:hypothetical protein